jgi:acyl-CoA thioester hydrolase
LTQVDAAVGAEASERRFTHHHQIRVRYAETDAMGVVYYANYLTYFEVARVEYLRAAGVEYRGLEDAGTVAAVTSSHVNYHLPGKFDDELTLCTRGMMTGKVRFRFEYEVWRFADNALIVSGYTEHALLSKESLRPVRLPDWLRTRMERFEAGRGSSLHPTPSPPRASGGDSNG